jgi:hypothetical protein
MRPSERIEVMVTVKAYPQLSQRSGEVVCVAGVRTDGERPEWIRLYPVPFRDLNEVQRFRKYDVISVEVSRGTDSRPESRVPRLNSIQIVRSVESAKNWAERLKLIGSLRGATTMCPLLRNSQAKGRAAQSLALIKPDVLDVVVEPNDDFGEDKKRLAQLAASENLLQPAKAELEPSPYLVKYEYRCAEEGCATHAQTLIGWELGEAGRKWSRRYPTDELPGRIRAKFLDQLCAPDRDTHFFVGNQLAFPTSFLVLGVLWPKASRDSDDAATLF